MKSNKELFRREIERQTGKKVSWLTFIGYKGGLNVFCADYEDGTEEDWICIRLMGDNADCFRR